MALQVVCFSCQQVLEYSDRVGLREECTKCGSDVHVCKNCDFHDAKIYNECREPQSDPIRERDRSNRCDFFRPKSAGGPVMDEKAKMRAAAEALFKKK